MPVRKEKKRTYSSTSVADNFRVREFERKDYDDVQRIYANAMMDNVPNAVNATMQHRYLLCLWLALTYFSIKEYANTGLFLTVLIFCGWGVFLYVNVRRMVASSIAFEARRVVANELVDLLERYKSRDKSSPTQSPTEADKDFFGRDWQQQQRSHSPGDITCVWVAMDKTAGNKVVGFLSLTDDSDPSSPEPSAQANPHQAKLPVDREPRIQHLYVASAYRHRGLATALLDRATFHAYRRGVKWVSLVARSWESVALAVCFRLGFQEVRRWSEFYSLTERVLLRLDLEKRARFRRAAQRSRPTNGGDVVGQTRTNSRETGEQANTATAN